MNSDKTHTIGRNQSGIQCARWEGACWRVARAAWRPALATLLLAFVVATGRPALAQTLTVLHGFGGADGANSEAGLIFDPQGNFYGTTYAGGTHGYGTVFMVSPSGVEKVLYSFTGMLDGGYPLGSLVRDAQGNLYGTTSAGGVRRKGVVFMVKSGKEQVLYSFSGNDGAYPCSNLIQDVQGNFYGTTEAGGVHNSGTVFKLTPSGIETVLYSFGGGADGFEPYAGLVQDAQGNLYGTTLQGGVNGAGTVYKVTLSGIETVLYNFTGGADGLEPYGGLVQDAQGNLYGTTLEAGVYGFGTVFEVFPSSGILRVLHSFTGTGGDGADSYAGLVRDSNGNLYGTTYYGGTDGFGTVFMVTPLFGIYRVLYSFTAGADGAGPIGGLVRDGQGHLYGTTLWYGTNGGGTVFKLTP